MRRNRAKRLLDVAIAVPALAALSPLFALVGVAIRLDSHGPVFFRQERVGKDARLFTCYKFRTMRHGADQTVHLLAFAGMAAGNPMSDDPSTPFKLAYDSRVTRIGTLLRRTSIDELPQLLNVLRGEMSIVGPRPAIPYELEHYKAWQHRRYSVNPGITGLWQVYGRGTTGFDEMIQLDVEYVDRWTMWLDIKLIVLTIPAILTQRGAR